MEGSEKKNSRRTLYDIAKGAEKQYPSLYDTFKLGDRVKRNYTSRKGNIREYEGIILAIGKDSIEVYWDTRDGQYMPKDMDLAFTCCTVEDIFIGTKQCSPIKKV